MENYQTAGIIVGIISTILWVFVAAAYSHVFLFPAFIAFLFMFVALADVKHHTTVGAIFLVVGILFNLLYLIPAIMALRWKPKLLPPTVMEYTPRVKVLTTDEEDKDEHIRRLEARLERLEKEEQK